MSAVSWFEFSNRPERLPFQLLAYRRLTYQRRDYQRLVCQPPTHQRLASQR
jgi:hypothetical protein